MKGKFNRLAIIGLGHVGELIAFTSVITSKFEEVYLYNRDSVSTAGRRRSDAILRNLTDASARHDVKIVKCENYEQLPHDAITVICIKEAYDYRYMRGNRMREVTARKDAPLIRKIAEAFANKDFTGEILMISNPVNSMSHLFRYYSGIVQSKIHPVGTILDNARYGKFIKEVFNDPGAKIDVMVAGEHGNSLVFLRSSSIVNGKPLSDLGIDLDGIEKKVMEEGSLIVRTLGYTNAGIVECLFRLFDVVSSYNDMQRIPFGMERNGVFVELPVRKSEGSYNVLWDDFDTTEKRLLEESLSRIGEDNNRILQSATERQQRRIIIVDDEPNEPESLAASLEECILDDKAVKSENEFYFDFAHSGERFVEKVIQEPIGYDLAIVDQRMPQISGLDSIIKAREYQPGLDCIILSGKSDMKDLQKMVNHDRLAFIEKPFFDPSIKDLLSQPNYQTFREILKGTQQKIA